MNAAAQMPEASSPPVMPTYGRLPIALSHGQGCRVWDVNGKEYLDALGGIASIHWATTTPSWCPRCRTN